MVERGLYRHFRNGDEYYVTGEATHTETGELLVIYIRLEDGTWHARPAAMFEGQVSRDGEMVPRFAKHDYRGVTP